VLSPSDGTVHTSTERLRSKFHTVGLRLDFTDRFRHRTHLLRAALLLAVAACSGCGTPRMASFIGSVGSGQAAGMERQCDLRVHGLTVPSRVWPQSRSALIRVPYEAAGAIKRASFITGMSAKYLAATAYRESSFRARAAARSSSAQGMFQFIEQTWLAEFARDGDCLGKGDLARHIIRLRSGRYHVQNRKIRNRILALRNDPRLAAVLAARLAQRNARALIFGLGRQPTPGEVYVAHFLGASSAIRLINLSRKHPRAIASRHFPKEASANRAIFYSRRRPRSVYEVWKNLIEKHEHLQFDL